jgi:hypothetical protein
MILEGIYRRFTPLKGGKGQLDVRLTHQESVAVSQVEPEGLEMTRAGRRFRSAFNGSAPTGIAPVQAIPTTTAAWVLWNGDTIKSYVMNVIGAMEFATGPMAVGGTVLCTIFQAPNQNGLAQATGLGIMNASNSAISSKAVIKSSVTITAPATPLWTPIAALPDAADSVGGISGPLSDVKGRIIVPPQYGLGISVLSGLGTTPTFLPVFDWLELELDLE